MAHIESFSCKMCLHYGKILLLTRHAKYKYMLKYISYMFDTAFGRAIPIQHTVYAITPEC